MEQVAETTTTVKTEKISVEDVGKVFAFYLKHKNKIFAALLLLAGGAGFNVDRILSAIPDVYGVAELKTKVDGIDSRVKVLEGVKPSVPTTVETVPPVVSDPEFKVARPNLKALE